MGGGTRLALVLFALLAGVVAMLPGIERSLLYFPFRLSAAEEVASFPGYAPVPGAAGDVVAWRRAAAGPVAVVAHGNGGTASGRDWLATRLVDRGVEPWLVEYPGYGARRGSPDEAGCVGAVLEAVDQVPLDRPVWLVGESLGSAAVAIAASLRPTRVAAVLLITPLPSVHAVASRLFPGLPAFLLADRFDARAALVGYPGRVGFLVAGDDEVIPTPLQQAWAADFVGTKATWVLAGSGHNEIAVTADDAQWDAMVGFLGGPTRP